MRAAVLLCAALALAAPPAAAAALSAVAPDASETIAPHDPYQLETNMVELERPPPLRMDHIKRQILAKLGLSARPVPQRAPPRDVVRQILSRAADPTPPPREHEHSEREIIAIAHRDKCAIGCKGSSSTPSFLNGHKYNYGVEGTVSIYLTGADKQETSVKVLGQASVSALGNCAYVLKLTNLLISGPDGKKYSKPTGLDKPIRFVLEDGQLAPELCAEEGDTRRSLNIKRAIISLLQSGQKSSSEVDIFGVCPTEASSSQEGGAILLHRSRDLGRCAFREHGRTGLAVFNSQAEVKNTQILQSNLNVESKLNNGVPEKVSAIEEHLYKPFSIGENGARAKVLTKLTLTGHAAGADTGNFKQVRSVIFENPGGITLDQSNYESALTAVKDTAKTLASEASSKSAGTFAQLIRILRPTTKEDLLKVYNAVKGNKLEKRVFLDGLLRAGTGHSIEASIQLLKSKELSTLEQNLVFLSLGNARQVNDAAVKSAASLLDTPNIPKEVYLGVGALAGIFCKEHKCHHVKNEGIAALSQKFSTKLGNCKPKGKIEEDYVVAVLKGIRNIRHLEDTLIDKLVQCANDNGVKARVRSAALDAFLADPCAAKLKKVGIDLMKNRQLDSEIRIKAYLAIIACPCGKSANEIKTFLDTETIHQVGHFITTSLRHIRASTNPDKRLAKQHYGLISTPSKFNTDDRKYSFYRELSYNVDALGLGGSVEQTVIYSQDSFLPRSASYNLTAEVFGHSLNIFEVGGRQGNLDRVVEHFLGPKSFLRTEDKQSLFDNLMKRWSETDAKVQGKLRGRRNVKTDIDNFDKHIKAEAAPYDNELDMDIYVKLFGTDAVFLSLGDDKGFDFNRVLDQILTHVDAGLNQAKKFQQDIRAHILFLDAEMAYATSTGLPLKLNLVGAATGRFELATSIDFRQIFRDPKNAKFDIKLIPSTDIEISGLFTVNGDAVSTGLKVVTNLHSSTGGHIIAKVLENGQGFDLQLGLPLEKQEIVTATNDLIFVTAEKGQKEKEIPIKVDIDKKEYSACFDQLSGVLGLTLCGDLSVPFSVSGPDAQASIQKFFARYPLTGSSRIKLHLEKNDLKGYHVKGIFKRDQPDKKSFELLFEAEGSKNRRTSVSGELVNTADEKSATLSLESPIKNLYGQVSLHTKPDEYAAVIKAKMDNEEYFGRAGFNVKGNADRKVFQPVLEYQMPGGQEKKSLKIDGHVVREIKGPETKYTLEGIKINMPNNEVVDVNGNIAIQPSGFDSELKAQKGEHKLSLNAQVKGADGKIEFQNTLNPYVNFKANVHSEFQKDNIHNDLELFYGGDLKQNRIAINQLFKYHHKSPQDFGLITTNKLAINAIPLEVSFGAEVDPKKVDAEFKGQYVDKKVDFDLEARTEIKKPGDYSVKVVAGVDDKGFEAFAKRDIVSADKSNLENYIVIKNIGKYELSGVVLHKMKPKDINIGVNGHLKVSGGGKGEDIKFDIGAIENANSYSSHAKISRAKVDFLDFLLKLNRGANPSGQLKFVLKDAVSANGQFKVTDADGKGNGMVIVDFKKAQRKIKGDIKFLVKDPTYNADVDLFLNFEKDNADKIHFSTNTKNKADDFSSKNKFDYSGKKFELNVDSKGELEQGKLNAGVEVVLPNERCLTLKVNREINKKDDVLNGHAHVTLSDALKRGGEASTLTYKAKLTNTNYEKEIYNHEGHVSMKLRDGKNLESTFHFKHEPVGENFKLEYKSDITGSLIPKPASISIISEYSDIKGFNIIDGFAKTRVKANYGDDASLEWISNEEKHLFEKGDKKYQEDNTITIRLPFEKVHDVKLVSNVLFLSPENKDVILEYTLANSLQVDADAYKFDASGKLGKSNGFSKVKVVVPHEDPFSLDASYKTHLEGEKKSGGVELKTTYGKGKTANIVVDATSLPHDYTLNIKANAPQAEKLKKIELNLNTKKPSTDSYSSSIIIDADGRVYKYDSSVVYSKSHPAVDLTYTSPSTDKPSRFFLKGSGLSSSQGKVDLKIENIRDLDLVASSEGSIQKEAVAIKVTADSQKLNLKNYVVDISSKDSGSGKRLEFQASNDNKNIFSGSTSFISKEEGPKTIIEGSGSVKVAEEQKSATFKYIRTLLTEGSEQGVETFMNVAIGDRSYVAESRVTNLEYKTSYVYCEEKKQCAHAELHSKIAVLKPGSFQHTVNVGLDLRKLGFAPEFGIQMNNEMSERRFPQYTLDVHMNKEDKKYHIHVYSQPEAGRFPQGITITLPTRVIAMESELSYPRDKALPFPIKGNVIMTLDKNKPQQQTSLRMLVDVTGQDKQHSAVAEFGFSHPKIGKEAQIKFRGKLQRPSERTIVLDSGVTVSHPSLGADRESKLQVEASPEHLKLLIETPVVKIIDLEGKTILKDNHQEGNLKFSLLQGKPVQVVAIAKDFSYFELSTSYSDEAQRKLSIIGHIDPEKRVDISADIILPKEKKNIIHGALYLQDNLVKSDYGASKENFEYFVNALKKDLNVLKQRVEQIGEKANTEVKAALSKVEPTAKDLEKAYRDEIEKLVSEFANDKVLKDLSRALNDIVEFTAGIIKSFIEITKPIVEGLNKIYIDSSKKIMEIYEKQIGPQVKQLYANIAAIIHEYTEGAIEILAHFTAVVTDFFEKHKAELQELTNTIAEIFKDLTRLAVSQLKEFRTILVKSFEDLTEQIKELPIIAAIKEKIQELSVPEQVLGILAEAHNTVRNVLPTEESKLLADAISSYVQKKLRQEKVDDSTELRAIFDKLAVAFTSVIQLLKQQLNQFGVPNVININPLPFLTGPVGSAPSLSAGIPSFSIINQLVHGDLPDPLALIKAYRPRSLDPLEELPAQLRAVVVNGQHIFTFDGRHLTFPGTCRYVLAHDHVDRNFTIIMQLQNGLPKAILLEDKSGTTVELKDNGQVAVNGAAHGFPVLEKDTFAFRAPDDRLGLGTTYGAMVLCTPKLDVCYIEVNGFYLGKLRGLLGDGNNEPWDDFRLPNGKIVSSEAEFGNAYRLSSSCPQVKTPEHAAHQHHSTMPAECEIVFGGSSPLRPLSLLLDIAPFRQACIHAVTGNGAAALKEACDLGRGYAQLAVTGLLPAVMPAQCITCQDIEGNKNLGDNYEIKLPAKKADIYVTVETTKISEKVFKDLVQPLVSQIVDGLKAKKIEDIKVILIGASPKYPYPILYDSDIKLKTAKIVFDDETRDPRTKFVKTGLEHLDKISESIANATDCIKSGLGLLNVEVAYKNTFMTLNCRADAVKHLITVVPEDCNTEVLRLDVIRKSIMHLVSIQNSVTHTIITTNTHSAIGNGQDKNHVIGFDTDSVLMLGDKKRGKDSEALRQTLETSNNPCFVDKLNDLVLSISSFNTLNPGQQKQFVHTAAGAITDKMTKEQLVQKCTCSYKDAFSGLTLCVIEDRKEAARRRK